MTEIEIDTNEADEYLEYSRFRYAHLIKLRGAFKRDTQKDNLPDIHFDGKSCAGDIEDHIDGLFPTFLETVGILSEYAGPEGKQDETALRADLYKTIVLHHIKDARGVWIYARRFGVLYGEYSFLEDQLNHHKAVIDIADRART